MIGRGTPSIHNNIPRPMMKPSLAGKAADAELEIQFSDSCT
jgi:hypothetical protein